MAIAAGFDFLGGAVGDLFEAKGHKLASKGYLKAADLAEQSAGLSEVSTSLKLTQSRREAYRVIGGQQADIAGAGFAASGSALDLMRASASEAALADATISVQGAIDKNDFIAQAQAYRDKAAQEKSAAKGSIFGSIVKGIAAVGAFALSDRRMKTHIQKIGTADNGLPIYLFKVQGMSEWKLGFMADEVQKVHPDAVVTQNDIFLVDYLKAVRPASA